MAEAAKKQAQEAEAARKKAEEALAARKKAEAEAAARRKAEASAAAKRKAEAMAKKKAEAAAAAKRREEEAARKQKAAVFSPSTPPPPAEPPLSPLSSARNVIMNLGGMFDSGEKPKSSSTSKSSSRAAPFDEPTPTVAKVPPKASKKSAPSKATKSTQSTGFFARFKKTKEVEIPKEPTKKEEPVKPAGLQRELIWGIAFLVVSVLLAVVSLTAMDGVCAAARPGWTVIALPEESSESVRYETTAPWWVPGHKDLKKRVFGSLCGDRPQTALQVETKNGGLRVVVSNIETSKSMLDVNGLTSVKVCSDRLELTKKKSDDVLTVDAPWKLTNV